MLEGPSFLVARNLPNGCEEESQWAYHTSQVCELSERKRPLEEKEETGTKRPSKPQEAMNTEENLPVILNLFPQVHQTDFQRQNGDNADTRSRSHDIGQGLSLNSLVNCSMSDCDSMSSDQPDFQCHSGDKSDSNPLVHDMNSLDLSLTLWPKSNHSSFASVRPGIRHHTGDNYDSSALIHEIGRDLSITCLLQCPRSAYCNVASLNRSFRSLVRSGQIYRLRRQMGIIEHWIYLCCNLVQWEAFDPISCKWMPLPSMNSNECFICADKESLAVGTELLVFGKQIDSLVIYKYSLLTHSWSFGMKTNTPRCLFASASLGELAIVAGGCDLRGHILNSAELYNSETGTWEVLPSMSKARKLCAAVFMDGKFYVIGGVGRGNPNAGGVQTSNPNELTSITSGEVYDLTTKSWHEIPNMYPSFGGADSDTPVTSKAPPLLAVVKNELYAAFYAEKELRKYNKETNQWFPLGKLPEQATSLHGWGLAFRACGNLLLVIGGPRASVGGFIEINAWEPNDGPPEWKTLGRKHSGSFVYNCAVMGC